MDDADLEKLKRVFLMLSSNIPGEVMAAKEALERAMRARGVDWFWMADRLVDPVPPPFSPPPPPRDEPASKFDKKKMRGLERTVETQRQAIRENLATIALLERHLEEIREENADLTHEVASLHAQIERGAQIERPASAADRRKAVKAFLATPEGKAASDREVGRRFGVSPQSVKTWRVHPGKEKS